MVVGSRDEVWSGAAHKTAGGLTKSDLVLGADGKVKSKKMVAAARARGFGGRGFGGVGLSGGDTAERKTTGVDPVKTRRARTNRASNARGTKAAKRAHPTAATPEEKFSIRLRDETSPAGISRAVRDQLRLQEGIAAALKAEGVSGAKAKAATFAPLPSRKSIGADLTDSPRVREMTTEAPDSESSDDDIRDTPSGPVKRPPVRKRGKEPESDSEDIEDLDTLSLRQIASRKAARKVADRLRHVGGLDPKQTRVLEASFSPKDHENTSLGPDHPGNQDILAGIQKRLATEGFGGMGGAGAILPGGSVSGQGFFEDIGRFIKKAAPAVGKVLKRDETAQILNALAAATGRPSLLAAAKLAPEIGGLLGGGAGSFKRISAPSHLAAQMVLLDMEAEKARRGVAGAGKKFSFAKKLGRSLIRVAPKVGRLLQRKELPGVLAALGGLVGGEKGRAKAEKIGRLAPKVGSVIETVGTAVAGDVGGSGAGGAGFLSDVIKGLKKAAPHVGRVLKRKEVSGIVKFVGKKLGKEKEANIAAKILPEIGGLLGGGAILPGGGFFQDLARGLKKAAPLIGRTLKRKEIGNIIGAIGEATGNQKLAKAAQSIVPAVGGLLGGGVQTDPFVSAFSSSLAKTPCEGSGFVGMNFAGGVADSMMGAADAFGRGAVLPGGGAVLPGGGAVLPGGGALLPGGRARNMGGTIPGLVFRGRGAGN